MNVTEIVDELRATHPRASDALRLQVLTLAASPPAKAPSFLDRLRHRRLVVLVPAAAGLAVTAAVAIGVTRPQPVRDAATAPSTVERSRRRARLGLRGAARGGRRDDRAEGGARSRRPAARSATSPRLTLAVDDTDALSEATQRSLAIARDLGGYVVAVQYATGEDGAASVTLRVPSARAGDAVTRLSALGTIVAQNVQIQDLQESLDGLDREIERLRGRIAALTVQLARGAGTCTSGRASSRSAPRRRPSSASSERAEPRPPRRRATRRSSSSSARRTARPPRAGSRIDRALDRALEVLAWEAVVALAFAVAAAPLVLVGAAVWATRRTRRRREDERLLAAS